MTQDFITLTPPAAPVNDPVTLINAFTVPMRESERFLQRWKDNARALARQPGFIRARMYRSLTTDAELSFINTADWDSETALARAQANPEWRGAVQQMLDDPELHVTARPAIYQVAVEVRPNHAPSRRVPSWVRAFNRIATRLLAAGVPMGPNALITVRGRKSGIARTTPITLIESSGRCWVMAPFGEGDWVRNLRAAGRASITVRRKRIEVTAVELGASETVAFFGDVLRPLVRQYGGLAAWIVRKVDKVDVDNPREAAEGRPVFELRAPQGWKVAR